MSSQQTTELGDLASPNTMSRLFPLDNTMLSPTSAFLNFSPQTALFNLGGHSLSAEINARRPSTAPAPASTDMAIVPQAPSAMTMEDVDMTYEAELAVLPSPSAFLFTSPITGNMDEWVAQSVTEVQNAQPQTMNLQEQFLSSDFYANLPNPEFDLDVFDKPATPMVDTFGMDIDPLMDFDEFMGQDVSVGLYPDLNFMPGQSWEPQQQQQQPQQAYNQPQQAPMYKQQQYPLTNQQTSSYYLPQTSINNPYQQQQDTAPQAQMLPPPRPFQPQQQQAQPQAQARSQVSPPTPAPTNTRPPRKNAAKPKGPAYRAEAPQKSALQPHIRINSSTVGLSTRTGKINNWNPSTDGGYISLPQPAAWTDAASGLVFGYNKWGEILAPYVPGVQAGGMGGGVSKADAAATFLFTPEQLRGYLSGSARNPGPPTLWVQRTPADSARRYPTAHSSCCRLTACPGHLYSDRKINVGSYRVAIDERWVQYGEKSDPMVVAGYVHLYCLERFLDLPGLVRGGVQVVADERVFPKEARGKWGCKLEGKEAMVAKTFLKAVAAGDGAMLARAFPGGYAKHASTPAGGRKVHEQTLTCRMTEAKLGTIPPSKQKMFEERGLKRSVLMVHKGDLEVYEVSKFNELVQKRGKGKCVWEGEVVVDGVVVQGKRGPEVAEEIDLEEENPGEKVAKKVVKRGRNELFIHDSEDEQMDEEDEERPAPRTKRSVQKRRRRVVEDSEDEDPEAEEEYRPMSRAKRLRKE